MLRWLYLQTVLQCVFFSTNNIIYKMLFAWKYEPNILQSLRSLSFCLSRSFFKLIQKFYSLITKRKSSRDYKTLQSGLSSVWNFHLYLNKPNGEEEGRGKKRETRVGINWMFSRFEIWKSIVEELFDLELMEKTKTGDQNLHLCFNARTFLTVPWDATKLILVKGSRGSNAFPFNGGGVINPLYKL